jgi:hypothetical protein
MDMKRGSTDILRGAIILIALAVLALCTFALPAGISSDNTGDYQPILLGLYIPAIPFFIALYQSIKLLSYIDANKAFTKLSVAAFKYIKYCAIVIGTLFVISSPYIYQVADKDDAPGVVAIAMIIMFASFVVATFAGLLQRLVQNAVDIKSENDLTV